MDSILNERHEIPAHIAEQLGHDLSSLARSVPANLISATANFGDNYPGYRPNSFCLRFGDGTVVKGRCFETPEQAETVESLSRFLGYRGLPRVLARFGRALFNEWIEGEPFGVRPVDSRLLQQCGALQGFAHSLPLPADSLVPPYATVESRRARVKRSLDALVQLDAVDAGLARTAAEIAAAHAPSSCASGFTYGDFCADNLILQPSGDICVVDNETLSIQPYDYDLGRTWYRWRMQRADRQAYFSGYLEHRDLGDFRAHFPYWAITAIADGALFRGRRGGATAAIVPVRRLRTLVHALERGVAAEEAIFLS